MENSHEMCVEEIPFNEDGAGFIEQGELALNVSTNTPHLNMVSEEPMDVTEDENVRLEFFKMENLEEANCKCSVELPTEFFAPIRGQIKNDAPNKESSVMEPTAGGCRLNLERHIFRNLLKFADEQTTPAIQLKYAKNCNSEQKMYKLIQKTFNGEKTSVKRPLTLHNARTQVKRLRFSDKDNQANFCIKESFELNEQKNAKTSLSRTSIAHNGTDLTLLATANEHELIGDFSRPHLLPLSKSKHSDLKSISSDTLACLINGHYNEEIESYLIIDCRYPYEYAGGHIRGATNFYTQMQINENFLKEKQSLNSDRNDHKRKILVFHCEFSIKRAPTLLRYLRSTDRKQNSCLYPSLHYPEIYLLDNGYKEFYKMYEHLCDPAAYRPMLDPLYNEALKHFEAKSKPWSTGRGSCKGTERRCLNY